MTEFFERVRGSGGFGTRDYVGLAASIILCQLAGIIPALATTGAVSGWYRTIEQPSFTPPNWVFGPVWTLLFLLMGVALFLVWRREPGNRLALGAFAVQLVLNMAWTLVFFGQQSPAGGLVVIAALWVAIVATITLFDRVDRRAAVLLVPYLAWVSFAAILNFSIWRLN